MKKIIFLTSTFCATILLVINWKTPYQKPVGGIEHIIFEKEEHAKTDEPNKFFEFHKGIRTREGDESPNYKSGYLLREARKATRSNNNARMSSNGVVEWTERGPGNVPGRTRALLNIPGDPNNNTWLAGSAAGGIWKTTNGGNTWIDKSKDFPVLPISSFAMSASNENIIYAGTGEHIAAFLSSIGDGIFKSTDKGETWTQLSSTAGNSKFEIVTRIIVDPNNPDIVLASTTRNIWGSDRDQTSIMKSVDGGTSWTELYTTTGAIEQLIASPNDFQILYASLYSKGVLKSTDGGNTWVLKNAGLLPYGRIELAISPVNPNKLFASVEGTLTGTGSDLHVSSDGGETWSVVDVSISSQAVDFLIGQGHYDNTILCDPFNENIVYYGGVSLFRSTVGTSSTIVDDYRLQEEGTSDFMFLQAFSNILWDNQRLTVGTANDKKTVEIRFGPGKTQKAHQFFVPDGATSGVLAANYTYQTYVDVPFEVWDISSEPNRQLMISFRDQNRNGFDLIPQDLQNANALLHSREYVFIHNVNYSVTPDASIAQAGGHEFSLMYNFFPCLTAGSVWEPDNLPASQLLIKYSGISKITAATGTVADSRQQFDGKNRHDQVNLANGVHADHHFMIPIIMNESAKTYRILLATDGGPFISNTSTNPGIVHGDWTFKGNTYITSQFYGADKKPGTDEYIGGMQDNGTRISKAGELASKNTDYNYALGGDGFEVLWHNLDENKIIGSIYYNRFYKSTNGGLAWSTSFNGFPLVDGIPDPNSYPFISRLANSKDYPERIFAIGRDGVWKSENFGDLWGLTPITTLWGTNRTFMDVEVSRANANIVWAGNSILESTRLHVSTDGGKSFSPTSNYSDKTMGVISKLASHPTEANTAYALFSYADSPKILRTTDLGQTWQDISGFGSGDESATGFPDVAVFCLYVRPDNPNIIWAGTEIGIVESLDNGQSWAMITGFPNVSVWDMKGQDNQVVIATHGRGIWTATIDAPQNGYINLPTLATHGTSPKNNLVLRIQNTVAFDSVELYVQGIRAGLIKNLQAGYHDVTISGVTPGLKNVYMISFKNGAPYQTKNYEVEKTNILSVENTYSTYFKTLTDIKTTGLILRNFPNAPSDERKTLQTAHPYSNNTVYRANLLRAIKVNANRTMFLSDIAITEPGSDTVLIEATKNGLDWIPLTDPYDASANPTWQTAYTNNQPGTSTMFTNREITIPPVFNSDDSLLFRFSLYTNNINSSWGWAINYITIQQTPTGYEEPIVERQSTAIFPNPTTGKFILTYEVTQPSVISCQVVDLFGRSLFTKNLGNKNTGQYQEEFDLSAAYPGTYLCILKTNTTTQLNKVILRK